MKIETNPKIIRGWAMFDWANSAYNLVITSTIFPAYYTIITTTALRGDKVTFFGMEFVNTALSNYALSAAYLIMALLLPVLSSTADYRGNKKQFMKGFTYMGGIACMGLFFFKLETLELGIICFALAAMGYIGGVLFNNSYLPQIALKEDQDRVSAQGFAYGYIGSVLLQIICFIFVLNDHWFADKSFPARLSFLLVGIWWIGFAQITFKSLPDGNPNATPINRNVIRSGFQELLKVWQQVKHMNTLKRFLPAFFFYAMGVQTIMLVAANFGEKILHLGTAKLIAVILVIQLVAIAGAYLMSYFANRAGNIRVLIVVLLIWIGVCISAYSIRTESQFYILAAIVGLVMGGIQSLSRSTYSKFIPANSPDTASFFSFYDVTEKMAIVIGLFTFGFMEELTGNMRNSALALAVFFITGLLILTTVPAIKSTEKQVGT